MNKKYKIQSSHGTVEQMMNAISDKIDELSINSSSSIEASDDNNLQTYLVTIGFDYGGPEDGPIWKSGTELVDATSKEEAEQIIADRYGNHNSAFDGCIAKLATQDDIDEFMTYVNEGEDNLPFDDPEYLKSLEDAYPDMYNKKDDRIWSDRVFGAFTPKWVEEYGDQEDYAGGYTEWELLESKPVQDFDGFWTEYTLWYNKFTDMYVCIFGDRDIYYPENADYDAEFETYDEAKEWFDCYSTEDEDDFEYDIDEYDSLLQ